jgi:hypothetical protein
MRDLAIHGEDLILATHGRSFWVLDDISPLRQFSAKIAADEATLLKPTPAVRAKRSTETDTPIQPDEPTARNPPDGAVIDYYLAHDASRPVTIEVFDSAGTLARRVSSTDPAPFTPAELARELIPTYWIRMTRAPAASAGMHRWVWDLHYATPRSPKRGFPISAVPGDTPQEPLGPPANPGVYRVRLSIGAHQWEQPLVVNSDPRVKIAPADSLAQFELAKRLADALDSSTGALFEARSLRAQLKDRTSHAGGALADRMQSLDHRIGELLEPPEAGGAPQRGLASVNGDFATLYTQATGADAAPTAVQVAETDRCLKEWQGLKDKWQHVRDDEVASLNKELAKASLPKLEPQLAPPQDLDSVDEE